jgi:Ca2+-binding RTX toxin-like protein
MATYNTSFIVNLADLTRILENIKIAEQHAAGGNLVDIIGNSSALLPMGLRTVDGSFNNLLPGNENVGAADQIFPRLLPPEYRNEGDDVMPLGGPVAVTNNNYDPSIAAGEDPFWAGVGIHINLHSVADADPRIISNLIVDQTLNNRAALASALALAGATNPTGAANALMAMNDAAKAALEVAAVKQHTENEYENAETAAGTANTSLADAVNALTSLLGAGGISVGGPDGVVDAADVALLASARGGINAALAAQNAVIKALQSDVNINLINPADLSDAQALKANILLLKAAADAVTLTDGATVTAGDVAAIDAVLYDGTTGASTLSGVASANLGVLAAHEDTAEAASNAADAAAVAPVNTLNAAVVAAGLSVSDDGSILIEHQSADIGLSPPNSGWMTLFGQFFDHGLDLVSKGGNGTVYIPLTADDPLYDFGRDGVVSSDDGTGADGIRGNADDSPNFMALTRVTPFNANGQPDPNGTESQNTTTPFVDQNQTYTSHASHQVFLREYATDENGHAIATGRLLNGANGGIANWAEVKAQALTMLGIKLNDFDVNDVPLLRTDAYGRFIPGANGFAQMITGAGGDGVLNTADDIVIEGSALGTPVSSTVLRTGHAFLNDIAHHAAPGFVDLNHDGLKETQQVADADVDRDGDGDYDFDDLDVDGDGTVTDAEIASLVADVNNDGSVNLADVDRNADGNLTIADFDINGDGVINGKDMIADDGKSLTFDNEMLNSHFITGDGRGNENIGLTAVHTIFHSEHNRVLEANKVTIVESGDLATINDWLRAGNSQVTAAEIDAIVNAANPADKALAVSALIAQLDTDSAWDGERMFQAARFTTEMQYQHMVFEEFARRVQPNVDPFIFTNSAELDPDILAEFAHVVYRFGHSMLTDTVDRLDNNLNTVGDANPNQTGDQQIGLIAAFLNPQAFTASGANDEAATGAIIRGMSRQVGNEIDEFIVEALRNNLVGLPLDLGALNIARGRDTGVPSLNDTRAQLYAMTGHTDVKPYTSWLDFAQHMKHPLSVVNFIAAYGTHSSITSATTIDLKRDAAWALVTGQGWTGTAQQRLDFLNSTGGATAESTGLNAIDLWVGGLAEEINEFGGQLGSTFNFVFEYQLEHLQNGDRFYYLSRTQGMNLLNLLEANTFSDIIMRNTDLGDLHATHLPAEIMEVPDFILELDSLVRQENYSGNAALNGLDPGNRSELDVKHEDSFQQLVDPKVVRVVGGVTYDYDDATDTWTARNVDVDGDGVITVNDNLLKFSGGDHVVLGGTENNDRLYGDKGIDTLWGDGGDDYLNAGMESDQVFGGDGDDIIEDPFGDDFLRGEAGDDVIVNGAGLDILFGGTGNDFIMAVTDTTEVFAGPGDDFILGGSAPDGLLGNEGDDWIEGGEGFDGLSGENSELFFNSPIVGHDILWGQGNDTDYDGENGDDIMVQSAGIQRNNGMEGFDWAIHDGDEVRPGVAANANTDMSNLLGAGAVNPAFILRDRFDSVEGLSGWNGNDTLSGASTLIVAGGGFDSKLTQAGVDRIDGLKYIIGSAGLQPDSLGGVGADPTLGNAPNTVILTSDHAHDGGEIILGGAGNDIMMGALGDDIMDGDAWLNVRISVHATKDRASAEVGTIESLTSVFKLHTGIGSLGSNETTNVSWVGHSVADLMRTGVVNPGQLQAIREVRNSDGTKVSDTGGSTDNGTIDINGVFHGDVDIAVFRDIRANYDVETDNDGIAGDTDGDGFIKIVHLPSVTAGGGGGGGNKLLDGTDFIRNFEVLKFADMTQIIQLGLTNDIASGSLVITETNGAAPRAFGTFEVGDTFTIQNILGITDADGVPDISKFTFTWQFEQTPGQGDWADITDPVTGEVITGMSFTPTFAYGLDGLSIRVAGNFTDLHGIPETVFSAASAPLVGTAPVGPEPPVALGALLPALDPAGDPVPPASIGIFEDAGPLTITRAQLLTGVTDLDTPIANLAVSNLAIRIRPGDPNPGTLTGPDINGNWTYTPAPDFNGGLVLTFDVSDGTNLPVGLEATLDVLAVNDAPVNPNNLLAATTPAGIGATPETFTLAELLANIPTDGAGNLIDVDGDTVTLVAGSVSSASGTVVDNGDGTFTFTPAPGSVFNVNTDIVIDFQLDDGTGSANAVTNATARIDTVNVAATGSVTINDTTPAEGQVLTATRVNIADVNGLGVETFQWQTSSDNGATWTDVAGATAATLTVGAGLIGQQLRAATSFVDQGGSPESIVSAATATVIANAAPTGAPVISEVITPTNPLTVQITPTEGQELSATALGLIADADGITPPITFQWQSLANGTTWTNIAGATNATFTPQDFGGSLAGAQAGLQLRVLANYVDGLGKPESVASLPTAPVGQNWAATPLFANNFNGTAGDDIAAGTNGVFGLGANDTLTGNAGNDILSGAGGTDTLNGGADNDRLTGGTGNDTVIGGTGSDTIVWNAGDGRDLVDGGTTAISSGLDTSSDTFVINGDASAEQFRIYTRAQAVALGVATIAQLNTNTEIVVTRNGTTNASIIAELDNIEEIVINGVDTTVNDGNGVVNGGIVGSDTITVIGNFAPPNTSLNFSTITINGSSSDDIVDISGLTSEHRIVFNTGGGNDTLVGPQRSQDVINRTTNESFNIVGTGDGDTISGSDDKEHLSGGSGDDNLNSGGGDDLLEGGSGRDKMNGGSGSDHASGGEGDDTFVSTDGDGNDWYLGGSGSDRYDASSLTSAVTINLLKGRASGTSSGTDQLHSIENAWGGSGNDKITGSHGNNYLSGGAGNDELSGLNGNDNLSGGAGDDKIRGGGGSDRLTGGSGNDKFVFNNGFGNDVITDFDALAAGGQDKLDLSEMGITAADFASRVDIIDQGADVLIRIDDVNTIKLKSVADVNHVTINDFVLFGG